MFLKSKLWITVTAMAYGLLLSLAYGRRGAPTPSIAGAIDQHFLV
jgi:hypothetical protein